MNDEARTEFSYSVRKTKIYPVSDHEIAFMKIDLLMIAATSWTIFIPVALALFNYFRLRRIERDTTFDNSVPEASDEG